MPAPSAAARTTAIILAAVAAAVGGIVYASHVGGPAPGQAAARAPGPAAGCGRAHGPFRESGATVGQRDGDPFVPYGITVPGLAHADYQQYLPKDGAQIAAAAHSWCANTVRLQVAQDDLVGAAGTGDSRPFLAAIKSEVSLAERAGLVTVICAQTQDVGHETGPTAATTAFWRDLAAVYGHDPQVVFDLFNEPRDDTGSVAGDWRLWRWGGTWRGAPYTGMQELVRQLRAAGARNLLWVEGPQRSVTLSGVPDHLLTGGAPLMYAVHHPAEAHDPTAWWHDFGFLVTRHIAPVVVGEWSNYAAARSECWPDAPAAVPAFLRYLGRHGIGMTVWALRPGVMLTSGNLSRPTALGPGWACRDGLDEGAGRAVMSWFRHRNQPAGHHRGG